LIFAVLKASLVHAQPWILAVFLFAIFFAASRLDSRTLRVVFFWIPTVTISCIELGKILHATARNEQEERPAENPLTDMIQ